MFGLHFVKTGKINKELGKFYSIIFDKRLTGDYDDFVDYNEEEVLILFSIAKLFLKEIDNLVLPSKGK